MLGSVRFLRLDDQSLLLLHFRDVLYPNVCGSTSCSRANFVNESTSVRKFGPVFGYGNEELDLQSR